MAVAVNENPDNDMSSRRFNPFPMLLLLVPALLASCDDADGVSQAAYPPLAVKTVFVAAENIPLWQEYPGRVAPVRLAEVRARVTGVVIARKFAEGSDVKAGELLFEIDPARFKAAVAAAKAQLTRAEAALALAVQQEARAEALLQKSVASKGQYDIAVASRRQAEAEVSVGRANLQTAELELSYASVRAPIDGRIGAALVTEGAFVRQEDGTQMATIRDLSSVYVDFTAPLGELSKVQQDIASGALAKTDEDAAIELIGEDGGIYGRPGRLLFSSAVVNETTGQVSLRAEFQNAGKVLLPGTYVRVRMTQGVVQQALLVPQRAVQWDTLGQATVMTVKDGRAVPQPIVTSRLLGNRWLVAEGLKPGDQVVVDGADKAMPGGPVTAQPLTEGNASKAALDAGCTVFCDQQVKL